MIDSLVLNRAGAAKLHGTKCEYDVSKFVCGCMIFI